MTCWSTGAGGGGRRVDTACFRRSREAPEEDLVSLIYFYEANHDAVVAPLEPPIGQVSGLTPVTSSDFIKERLDAITVG